MQVIQSATNNWSYRFEFLVSNDGVNVYAALWKRNLADKRTEVVRMEWLPESSPTLSSGLAVAKALGWRSLYRVLLISIPIPAETTLSVGRRPEGQVRSNLRNRERRLGSLGDVRFQVVQEGEHQLTALKTFYEF